jgi:hypothetical protein
MHDFQRHRAAPCRNVSESTDLLASTAAASSCQQIAQLLDRQMWIASMKHAVAVGTHERQILRFGFRGSIELVNRNAMMRLDKTFPELTERFGKVKFTSLAFQLSSTSQSRSLNTLR